MTCKEKLKLGHPEWSEEKIDNEIKYHCPHGFKYEYDVELIEECRGSDDLDACVKCWDQEIRTKEDITESIKVMDEHFRKCFGIGTIKDSGDRTEFASGAVRDMREGKGRCDLLPLDIVSGMYNDGVEYVHEGYSEAVEQVNDILTYIHSFCDTGDVSYLYYVLESTKLFLNRETMLLEVAIHFEEGAKKYGDNNWRKGIPAKCYIDSAVRHYLKCIRGDKDEPHDRAFVWNILCCIWTCKHHPELNDFKKEN